MAENSSIEWTTHTFNCWIGCTKVAEGCKFCYAEADMDHRRGRVKWGPQGTRSRTSDDYWLQPLRWNRKAQENQGLWGRESAHAGHPEPERPRVFCASLADVFEDWQGPIVDAQGRTLFLGDGSYHTEGPPDSRATMDDLRCDLFALIDQTPHLDWLLLTKRPENIRKMWAPTPWGGRCASFPDCTHPDCVAGRRRENVWLGYSASTQADLERGIGPLLARHDLAPVLFLSLEPLVGPVDLTAYLRCKRCGGSDGVNCDLGIHWAIVGGESGRDARPMDLAWARSLLRQCCKAGVPAFFKQAGSNPYDSDAIRRVAGADKVYTEVTPEALETLHACLETGLLRLRDPKGGDLSELSEDLRVRQFPAVKGAASISNQ